MVQTGKLSPLVSTTANQNQVSTGSRCPRSHHTTRFPEWGLSSHNLYPIFLTSFRLCCPSNRLYGPLHPEHPSPHGLYEHQFLPWALSQQAVNMMLTLPAIQLNAMPTEYLPLCQAQHTTTQQAVLWCPFPPGSEVWGGNRGLCQPLSSSP